MATNTVTFHKTDLHCPICGRQAVYAPDGEEPVWQYQDLDELDCYHLIDGDALAVLHICIDCRHFFFYDDKLEYMADQMQDMVEYLRTQCQSISRNSP